MTESRSTDKLISLSMIVDKTIEKIPKEKITKLKLIEIKWVDQKSGYFQSDHPLPELKIEFHP